MKASNARVLATAVVLAFCAAAQAQDGYPQQPVRLVVAAPAGGGTDMIARVIGNAISTSTGWTIVVDNRPGASGTIGTAAVAKAKPDGYTLGMGQTATLAIAPELFKNPPYDPLKDLIPIAAIAEQPLVLVVRADSKFRTLADLIAAHKSHPLTVATAGDGSVGQMASETFGDLVGTKFLNVPYKGTAPALQDVVGGQTDIMFATPPGALPLIQGRRLRALAVTSSKRLPLLAEVPTVAESGYREFQATEWKVLVAPAGTPPSVVTRWNQEMQKVIAQPDVVARIVADGNLPLKMSVPETEKYVRREYERWVAVVRGSGQGRSR